MTMDFSMITGAPALNSTYMNAYLEDPDQRLPYPALELFTSLLCRRELFMMTITAMNVESSGSSFTSKIFETITKSSAPSMILDAILYNSVVGKVCRPIQGRVKSIACFLASSAALGSLKSFVYNSLPTLPSFNFDHFYPKSSTDSSNQDPSEMTYQYQRKCPKNYMEIGQRADVFFKLDSPEAKRVFLRNTEFEAIFKDLFCRVLGKKSFGWGKPCSTTLKEDLAFKKTFLKMIDDKKIDLDSPALKSALQSFLYNMGQYQEVITIMYPKGEILPKAAQFHPTNQSLCAIKPVLELFEKVEEERKRNTAY